MPPWGERSNTSLTLPLFGGTAKRGAPLRASILRGLVLAVMASALVVAAPASANGPCGQNYDGNHACGVNSPATENGTLVTDNESDYYVFHAQKGTELQVSITDTEDPTCDYECGSAEVGLYDASGNEIDSPSSCCGSSPQSGINVPASFSTTIEVTGTYYLIVGGNLGQDSNGNPTSVPYSLNVGASPNVQWPPPPPPPSSSGSSGTSGSSGSSGQPPHRHHHRRRHRRHHHRH